jgi:tRNA (guanosine-2'-O-)-methyltransferase
VAIGRTHKFIPILSDIYDRGNISAVLRSAEGMGFGEIHLIQRGERFRVANRVTRGADEWLDIFTWNDPTVVSSLKSRGYKVYSTGFENAMPLEQVDFKSPVALIFGNEKDGVKPDISELCDGCVYIPMNGFSQSFNISVAAAISMYAARLNIGNGDEGHLKFYRGKLLLKSLTNAEQLLGALNV